MGRSPCCQKEGLRKGVWTPDEDQKLMDFIGQHGHGNWRALPKKCGLLRCGKSCRLRWTNYLRPDIKRGQFSHSEEQKIIHLHALVGNKWAFIASQLPKRTDNEIKNYWNTVLKKRLPKMGLNNVLYQQKGLPDSVSNSDTKLSGSTLSHLAQWESARVEAEARLAKESNVRAKGAGVGFPVKTGSSAPSHIPPTPSKLQEALVLLKQSSSSVHPMSFASNVENSLQEQMNQVLRVTSFSSSTSGSALSSDSFELRPSKSTLYSAQDSNCPLKLTSNGSLTWNSHELLSKDSAMSDFLRFSKLCPEKLDEGAESDPRHLFVFEKGLQSVTKGEQLLTLDGGECHSFADLHELLFVDDSGSCLSPHSTTPWSKSSEAIIHVCSTDMEDNRELSEATITTSNLNLEKETPRSTNVEASTQNVQACHSSVKAYAELQEGKPSPHNSVSKDNEVPRDSLLPQYDSITEGNTSHWNTFLSQLLESPCARPLGNSATVGAGIAGF